MAIDEKSGITKSAIAPVMLLKIEVKFWANSQVLKN